MISMETQTKFFFNLPIQQVSEFLWYLCIDRLAYPLYVNTFYLICAVTCFPVGSYCVAGTEDAVPCPAGTFGAAIRLKAESECTQCTAGYFCETPGLTAVEGPCGAGYYCETGSNTSQQYICPEGHYCPQGSATASRCPVVCHTFYSDNTAVF